MGKSTPEDEMPLQPQVTFETFDKGGMDFNGPIDPPLGQKKYIIMWTDYFTKCAKTKVVKVET